eukprot:CAMPEP_0206126234 /NCGR_PEP_ID=MMETSP1472-20131121/21361_1 /ASSEMBLY_ACC=CAM_ASM_001108 /TAXON_ID=41880 /ORGANISM="Pycnococcus provasolii, Strain RCC251" /LENGTH=136 /DNA_ID=CAMNT_0053517237 /DNA_START=69 /DNA_END=476 /DNA_ORIENTATION=-
MSARPLCGTAGTGAMVGIGGGGGGDAGGGGDDDEDGAAAAAAAEDEGGSGGGGGAATAPTAAPTRSSSSVFAISSSRNLSQLSERSPTCFTLVTPPTILFNPNAARLRGAPATLPTVPITPDFFSVTTAAFRRADS